MDLNLPLDADVFGQLHFLFVLSFSLFCSLEVCHLWWRIAPVHVVNFACLGFEKKVEFAFELN
jgi:hypothetical protein